MTRKSIILLRVDARMARKEEQTEACRQVHDKGAHIQSSMQSVTLCIKRCSGECIRRGFFPGVVSYIHAANYGPGKKCLGYYKEWVQDS